MYQMCKLVFGCFLYYYSVPWKCDILVPTVMSNKINMKMTFLVKEC